MKKILLILLITLISCNNNYKKTKILPTNINYEYSYNQQEIELINLINNYREEKGLNKLEIDNYISIKCSTHNSYMIKEQKISHDYFKNRSDSIIAINNVSIVGENLACGYLSSKSVLNAWIKSENHKKQLEKITHKKMGLSIRFDTINNQKYYTNIFTN